MNLKINSNSKSASNFIYLDRMSEPVTIDHHMGLYIGRSNTYKLPFLLDLDKLVNRNIAVVGMSGSGKSYFLKSFIIKSCLQRDSKVLIIDWNNEYREVVSFLEGKTLTLGSDFKINLFDLYNLKNIRNIKNICDIISYSVNLNNDESYVVYNKLLSLHSDTGARSLNLKKLIKTLNDANSEQLERISKKLLQLKESPMFADKTDFKINTILDDVVNIDFSMLRDDLQRNEISKSIFKVLIELMHNTSMAKTAIGTEKIIILDEAWRLIKNSEDVGTLFREGRKYGFCIAIATQMANDINNEVISNSACLFIFRLQNDSDYRMLIDCGIINNDHKRTIMELPVGSCMVSMALTSSNGKISKFFIESIDGISTHEYKIRSGKMQHIISHRIFSDATKNLLATEEAKERITNFVLENDSEVEDVQLIQFIEGLKIERFEIICYLRRLGLKDVEIAKAYEGAVSLSVNR